MNFSKLPFCNSHFVTTSHRQKIITIVTFPINMKFQKFKQRQELNNSQEFS